MSIENLNLLAHTSAALWPVMTRTISLIPLIMITVIVPDDIPNHWLNIGRIIGDLTIDKISRASPILGLGASLLVDAGAFAATAIGSVRALKAGIAGDDRALASTAKRTALSGIGIAGLAAAAHGLKNLALGLAAYRSLDSEQQYFILKHRAVETLAGQEKNCHAVIIDGISSEWGAKLDDGSLPLAEELYRNCDVRTYRADPNSNTPVCDAAKKGKEALGGPVDILAIMGHGTDYRIQLKDHTYFKGKNYETTCLKEHLKPDAQMILAGCNTATGNNSLAEKVSRHLSGIEVVGFSAYLNPYLTTSWLIGKKLSAWSFWPIDSQGNWIFPWTNTARTFKSDGDEPQYEY